MDTLESIVTDLLNICFEKSVSLEELVEYLKDKSGGDLEKASHEMIMAAIKGIELPQTDWKNPADINWHEIRFGCDEYLARCLGADQKRLRSILDREFDQLIEMCALFLVAGLLTVALENMQDTYTGLDHHFVSIMAPFGAYLGWHGEPFIDDPLERLLFYIFRPMNED